MSIQRFFYVRSPNSSVMHMLVGSKLIEGERLVCGLRTKGGWLWNRLTTRQSAKRTKFTRCKRCVK